MSRVLEKALLLKPEIRLAQAVSEFEADLSTEQKATFRTLKSQSQSNTPDPSDVMRLTAEMDRSLSIKYSSRCFGPRFTNFLQGVQQFAALGDVVVGGSQNLIACGVWSLVRMSLLSIISLSSYIDKLSSIFMAIGRAAPRYQAMALLYPRSKKLQSHLAEYFILVVKLCHYLFKYEQKSSVRQFTSSLNDTLLKTLQTDLDKWANSIKEEVNLIEAQENSRSRAFTMEMFKSSTLRWRYETKMRVLNFCSKFDHETAWKQIRKLGNSSFHTQSAEYQEWKTGSLPGTIIFTGKLGSGKSVLLANIVDDLNLTNGKDQSTVAYFFCKYDILGSLQTRTILGSLVRQLLSSIPDLGALAKRYEDTQHREIDIEELLEFLFQGFTSRQKVYLVIDGLDECDFAQKETLIKAIQKIQDTLKVWICASIREESNNNLQSITTILRAVRVVSLPDDNPDIEAFVETELERCLSQGKMTIGDPTLILEIQDALLNGSQGMFLWVALQIQTLCKMKTDCAMREALANLPRDLSETFSRILSDSGSSDPSLQAKVLQLVLAANRPLTTIELREALSVIPGDATWDPSRLLHDVYSALACCGCLLAVDEEEFTLRFVHHSVKQYIVGGLNGMMPARFTLRDAKRTMANLIVTYLNYGVFGTEISKTKVLPIMAQSAPSKILQATLDPSSSTRHLAMKFLKSRRQPTFDLSKMIAETLNSSHSESNSSFNFYEYANKNWLEYLSHVSGQDTAIFRLSSKLIHSRASAFNISDDYQWEFLISACNCENGKILGLLLQLGKIDPHQKLGGEITMLMWAASEGQKELVEVLLKMGKVNVDEKGINQSTALMCAARNGQIDTAKILIISGKADINAKDIFGNTALMCAILGWRNDLVERPDRVDRAEVDARDHIEFGTPKPVSSEERWAMVNLLLTIGKADVNAKNNNGSTALIEAATNGYADLMEMVLIFGAHANVGNFRKRTALMCAAEHGMRGAVEVLLVNGKVDVDAAGPGGTTALMFAATEGNAEIIEALISIGKADANARDFWKRTALMCAAERGRRDAVEALISISKADVNARDYQEHTALMFAAMGGNAETVEALINSGKAAVNAKDNQGWTALILAAMEGNTKTVEALINIGKADVNAKDNRERTALMFAATGGNAKTVEALISIGKADVNARDDRKRTALMFAATGGNAKTVEALISIGKADVNVKDNQGRTALMHAAKDGKRDSAKALLDTGIADINDKGDNGRTALMRAVLEDYEEIVKLLLSTGKVDVHVKDKFGTALDYAKLHEQSSVISLLQSYSASQ
ncbi:hypothetical protein BM1_10311 [Bipolaris maydis]|nr:hypothetical protein BM1_10311 [Bipolaris maydis]